MIRVARIPRLIETTSHPLVGGAFRSNLSMGFWHPGVRSYRVLLILCKGDLFDPSSFRDVPDFSGEIDSRMLRRLWGLMSRFDCMLLM